MSTDDRWAHYLDPESDRAGDPAGAGDRSDVGADSGPPASEAEQQSLDRIAAILSGPAVWDGPSDDLKDRLLGQVAAEVASAPGPDSTVEPVAGPVSGPGPGRGVDGDGDGSGGEAPSSPGNVVELNARRSRRPGLIAGAAAAAVGAAAAVLLMSFVLPALDDRGSVTTFEVAGTELTPDVDATVDVEPLSAGVALTLNITGLPPAGDGQYYAAWLMTDDMASDSMAPDSESDEMESDDMDPMAGSMVGIGSFHWRQGGIPIELWSGVDTERYPVLLVTLQDEDGPPTASDVVVMTARLDSAGGG